MTAEPFSAGGARAAPALHDRQPLFRGLSSRSINLDAIRGRFTGRTENPLPSLPPPHTGRKLIPSK